MFSTTAYIIYFPPLKNEMFERVNNGRNQPSYVMNGIWGGIQVLHIIVNAFQLCYIVVGMRYVSKQSLPTHCSSASATIC